jgi:hypothetical protein
VGVVEVDFEDAVEDVEEAVSEVVVVVDIILTTSKSSREGDRILICLCFYFLIEREIFQLRQWMVSQLLLSLKRGSIRDDWVGAPPENVRLLWYNGLSILN